MENTFKLKPTVQISTWENKTMISIWLNGGSPIRIKTQKEIPSEKMDEVTTLIEELLINSQNTVLQLIQTLY